MRTQPDGLRDFRLVAPKSDPGLKVPGISAAWKEYAKVQSSRQIRSSHKTPSARKHVPLEGAALLAADVPDNHCHFIRGTD